MENLAINNTKFTVGCAGRYSFGFNGMEKDNEVYGKGNAYTTKFRELDPRLGGRWFTPDPVFKAYESPYAGFSDNPVHYSDPMGNSSGPGDGEKPKPYSVKSGDDMTQIAKKYGTSLKSLEAANSQIKDPNKIYPNEKINIPAAQTSQKTQAATNSSGTKDFKHSNSMTEPAYYPGNASGGNDNSSTSYDQPYGEAYYAKNGIRPNNNKSTAKITRNGGVIDASPSNPIEDFFTNLLDKILYGSSGNNQAVQVQNSNSVDKFFMDSTYQTISHDTLYDIRKYSNWGHSYDTTIYTINGNDTNFVR